MRRERELMIAVVRMGRLFLTENAPHGASVSPKVKPARFIPVAATIGKRAHGLGTIRAALQMRPAHVLLPAGETLSGQPCRMAIAPERSQPRARLLRRSEEHTSELQSLMRNSYAVFCLKKKQQQ